MDILEITKERHRRNQLLDNDVNAESRLSIQTFSTNRNVLIPLWIIMENLKM